MLRKLFSIGRQKYREANDMLDEATVVTQLQDTLAQIEKKDKLDKVKVRDLNVDLAMAQKTLDPLLESFETRKAQLKDSVEKNGKEAEITQKIFEDMKSLREQISSQQEVVDSLKESCERAESAVKNNSSRKTQIENKIKVVKARIEANEVRQKNSELSFDDDAYSKADELLAKADKRIMREDAEYTASEHTAKMTASSLDDELAAAGIKGGSSKTDADMMDEFLV